jgi:hypothetical protein
MDRVSAGRLAAHGRAGVIRVAGGGRSRGCSDEVERRASVVVMVKEVSHEENNPDQ